MTKKRNWIGALIICLFLGLLCFTGASTVHIHGLNPNRPVKITVWHYYNGSQSIAFDELVSEFNATLGNKTGIIAEAVSKSSVDDLINAVTASARRDPGAEELPDMFQCYLDTAVSLDEMGFLANLEPYITEEEKASYIDSYISEGILGTEEALKLFPIAKSTELLVVNETAFRPFAEKTGVSEADLSTWEGLLETAEKYYTYSGGKSFFGRDAFANYMIVGSMQLGEEIFQVSKGNVTVNLNEDAMRRLWDNYYVPYVKGYYLQVGRFRSDDIKLGNVIASVGSSTGMSYLPSELTDDDGNTVPVDYLLLPVPNFSGTQPYAVQQGASMAVTKASETKEYACVVFLEWLTEEEHNIGFSVSSDYLPVKKAGSSIEKVNGFLEKNNIVLPELDRRTLETAITQTETATLYTSRGFRNGYEARNLLNYSMIDLAIADRGQILDAIASGVNESDAVKPYLTDTYFEQWYHNLQKQMDEICTE